MLKKIIFLLLFFVNCVFDTYCMEISSISKNLPVSAHIEEFNRTFPAEGGFNKFLLRVIDKISKQDSRHVSLIGISAYQGTTRLGGQIIPYVFVSGSTINDWHTELLGIMTFPSFGMIFKNISSYSYSCKVNAAGVPHSERAACLCLMLDDAYNVKTFSTGSATADNIVIDIFNISNPCPTCSAFLNGTTKVKGKLFVGIDEADSEIFDVIGILRGLAGKKIRLNVYNACGECVFTKESST